MNLGGDIGNGYSTSANRGIRSSHNTVPNENNNSSSSGSNASRTPPTNKDRTTTTMNMEARLHNVAASFRQKRDEAYRLQQVAYERCKLVDEEVEVAQQTVEALRTKLNHLQQQAGCTPAAKEELQKLQSNVTILTREVRYDVQWMLHCWVSFRTLCFFVSTVLNFCHVIPFLFCLIMSRYKCSMKN
jgi:hypothetical protein